MRGHGCRCGEQPASQNPQIDRTLPSGCGSVGCTWRASHPRPPSLMRRPAHKRKHCSSSRRQKKMEASETKCIERFLLRSSVMKMVHKSSANQHEEEEKDLLRTWLPDIREGETAYLLRIHVCLALHSQLCASHSRFPRCVPCHTPYLLLSFGAFQKLLCHINAKRNGVADSFCPSLVTYNKSPCTHHDPKDHLIRVWPLRAPSFLARCDHPRTSSTAWADTPSRSAASQRSLQTELNVGVRSIPVVPRELNANTTGKLTHSNVLVKSGSSVIAP